MTTTALPGTACGPPSRLAISWSFETSTDLTVPTVGAGDPHLLARDDEGAVVEDSPGPRRCRSMPFEPIAGSAISSAASSRPATIRTIRLMGRAPSGSSYRRRECAGGDVPLGGPRKTPAGEGSENGLLSARTAVDAAGAAAEEVVVRAAEGAVVVERRRRRSAARRCRCCPSRLARCGVGEKTPSPAGCDPGVVAVRVVVAGDLVEVGDRRQSGRACRGAGR